MIFCPVHWVHQYAGLDHIWDGPGMMTEGREVILTRLLELVFYFRFDLTLNFVFEPQAFDFEPQTQLPCMDGLSTFTLDFDLDC